MTAIEGERRLESTLIITSGPVLSLDETDTALSLCAQQDDTFWNRKQENEDSILGDSEERSGVSTRRERTHVMTSALLSKDARRVESTRYGAVIVVMEKPGNHNHSVLTKEEARRMFSGAAMMLQPGGYLYVVAPRRVGEGEGEESSWLRLELTMLGFNTICTVRFVGKDGQRMVASRGVKYEKKGAQAISLGPQGAGQTWKVAMDDDDDDELIDEEDLLGDDEVAVEAAPVDSSCGATAKKACANCTCGRAEGKVTKLTKEMLENPQSGCGSCSLGDAFRCAGCPYRGLPAFEMGKKIELPADFLVDDLE